MTEETNTAMAERVDRRAIYSEDAEQAVLGSMLLDPARAVTEVMTVLTVEDFYRESHRRIFAAIVRMVREDRAVDPVTLADELDRAGDLRAAGGKDYLGVLLFIVPTADNVLAYAAIVRDRSQRRRIVALARDMQAAVCEDLQRPAQDVLAEVTQKLAPIATVSSDQGFQSLKSLLWPFMEELENVSSGRAPGGRKTGYPEIDEKLHGGLQDSELVVLCANPKMGKTAMAINIILNGAVEYGIGAGFVSAEMSKRNIVKRVAALMAEVETTKLRSGKLDANDMAKITRAIQQLSDLPIWVDDTPLPDVDDIVMKVRLLKARHPEMRTVVVDFLQLIQKKHQRGQLDSKVLSDISYQLKGLAKELDLTVIATAQPNDKQVDARDDKRPQLRDIQGSGGIRQAADMVAMLYRPAVDNPAAGPTLEFMVGAARDLPPFKAILEWEGKFARVTSPLRKKAAQWALEEAARA